MFSQNPMEAQAQMEALAQEVSDALLANTATTITSTTRPTQAAIQTGAFSMSTRIAPEKRIIWYDGTYVRGEIGSLRDYLVPHTASNRWFPGGISSIRGIFWRNRVQYYLTGSFFTTTVGVPEVRTHAYYFNPDSVQLFPTAAEEVVAVNANGTTGYQVITVDSSNNLRVGSNSGVTTTGLGGGVGVGANRPVAAAVSDTQSIFFRDSTNPNDVKRRVFFGTVTTVQTAFPDLAAIYYDSTTDKVILISNLVPTTTSSAWRMDTTGANLTQVIPPDVYAAGHFKAGYRHIGVEVRDGKIYAPVPGSLYLTTRRVYDILTGTYVEEEFDFREAKTAMAQVSKEARHILEAAQGAMTQQRAYYGTDYYAYVFERLLDVQRSPDGTADLLTYEIGPVSPLPGASAAFAWAVLPHDGVSGRLYPLTEPHDPRGDFFVVKEQIFDTALKELSLEWPEVNTAEFGTIVIEVDNGLTTANENIRVQLNGDTTSSYSYTTYRGAVAAVSNVNANSAAHWEFPALNTTTVLGGKYMMTFVDYLGNGQTVGMVLEGSTIAGITTGLITSIIGGGKWINPVAGTVPITSVRFFLSGAAAFFAAGAKIRVTAYRTRGPYSRANTIGVE